MPKQVAAHLGTEHTELYVTPAEAQAVIPKLQDIYDEPFAELIADSDLSRVGDDAAPRDRRSLGRWRRRGFRGLQRYGQGLALARMIAHLPKPMRQAMAGAMTAVAPGTWDYASLVVPRRMRPRLAGDKIHKFAGVLPEDAVGFYRRLITQWPEASCPGGGRGRARRKRLCGRCPGAIRRRCRVDAISRYAHLSA